MSKDTAAVIPSMPCPDCGYVVDRSTCVNDEGAAPRDGDISVCLQCGALANFAATDGVVTALHKLEAGEEFKVLMEHPNLGRMCRKIRREYASGQRRL